uniref:Hexosyltransferase n=1 Tax=Sexangularia sp. CB-2014 TaxID=1486929 RepID=A0A7S1VPN5_9EUKA|mmetsp:Transcript_7518/g.24044  ORF Transcript_7518/g.24044 Transcript_7518/m.24044 type:complete len:267 (+) Transcript_7518:47-847(+)
MILSCIVTLLALDIPSSYFYSRLAVGVAESVARQVTTPPTLLTPNLTKVRQLSGAQYATVSHVDAASSTALLALSSTLSHSPRSGATSSSVLPHKEHSLTKLKVWRPPRGSLSSATPVLLLDADVIVNNASSLADICSLSSQLGRRANRHGEVPLAWARSVRRNDTEQGSGTYHGIDLPHYNGGVILLRPDALTYLRLRRLAFLETLFSDSCLGRGGCNDQRLLQLYFRTGGNVDLPLRYNHPHDEAAPIYHRRGGKQASQQADEQ